MAITSRQIIDFLLANPSMTDDQIVTSMKTYGISPAQMAEAVGVPVGDVISRAAATVAPGNTITLGDTRLAPTYDVRGSGEDQQIGAITNILVEKTTGDINYKAPVGSEVQVLSPTGEFVDTIKTQKVGGLKEALKDPYVLAFLAIATGGASGLFSGAGGLGGATALTAAEAAGLGLTATEAAALGLSATEFAAATAAAGTAAGVGTAGTVAEAALTAQDLAIGGGPLAGTPPATIPGLLTPAAATTAATTLTPAATTAATTLTPAATTAAATTAAATIPAATTAATVATTAAATGLTTAQVANLVQTGLTTAQIANLFSTGATTAAGLLQQQTSREAAIKAQAMIDRETAAAKAAAQFRPIGMTTRFGSSQFVVDPVTGRLTSAGYTLSPEAKNAQDRFVKLAESGLQQAEGAQLAFKPLQTGAESLFKLGQGYLAKSPEDVAQNYLNQQMALLKPGRELELATLQNRLQQQGRGGLSVAQGGTLGATTPELQALYNARVTQEAQLAANAQQLGQRDVLFGAGLLGQGSQAMGQYYGGQQAAYAPYTTALGQVTGLETSAQQPFTLSTGLAEKMSAAGSRMGDLGLKGAGQSVALATGADATRNPYASAISGITSNPLFTDAIAKIVGGTPVNALDFGAYGTGDAGFQKMLEEVYG